MDTEKVLIACGIFRDEIEYCLAGAAIKPLEIHWLEPGLHNDLEVLENKLKDMISRCREGRKPQLKLLFGYGCLPDLRELARQWEVAILPTKNCLSALMGEERIMEMERDRTMVITPAWIRRMWLAETGLKAILGWTEVDFRLNFGRYDRILVLDAGIAPLTDEEILETFDIVQVPIEIEPCDLSHFQTLMLYFLETGASIGDDLAQSLKMASGLENPAKRNGLLS